jgi:hypothetical protein
MAAATNQTSMKTHMPVRRDRGVEGRKPLSNRSPFIPMQAI